MKKHFEGMSVLNDTYQNQHSGELRGKVIFIFFPHSLPPPKSYGFPYSLTQFKEIPSITANHFSPGIFTYHSGSLPGYPIGCPSIGGILKLLFDNSFDFCGQSFLTGNKYHCGKRNLEQSRGVRKKVIFQ